MATPVNFTLVLDGRAGSAASQVARALIEAIARGQIHDGDRLPSTRTLAASFALSRSAVVGAYEELTAAGFLAAQAGGFTRVEQGAGAAARAGAFGEPPPPTPALDARPAPSPIAYDLRVGLADPGLISQRDWARAARAAAAAACQPEEATDRLGQLTHAGHAEARRQLAGHLRRARGLTADPDDLFLFPSITVALAAVTATCGLAGGPVAFEDPGYAKARLALRRAGARIRPIPVDDDGVQAADLQPGDRAVYVTPAHQWPLGGRMPARRRAELLAWAQRRDALVLEDDYDGEFRYGVPPLPPLRSMPAAAQRVVYLGTSAKVLTRSLRVSWALLPARFRAAMTGYLDQSGDDVSTFAAALLASYISSGALTRHQARAMRTYSARQARFVAACRQLIPGVRAHGIEAGLHVVLTFGARLDDTAAVTRLADLGLACAPLSAYYADPASAEITGLICGYSRLPETRARGAAELIARVTAGLLPGRPSASQVAQHRG
jgi:GntR family transcriptional regulator/MocR family aminotransferase